MSDYNIPVSGGVNGLNVPLHGHIAVYNKEFPVIPNPEGEATGYVTKLGFTPEILQVKDPEVHDWARAEEKPTYTKAEVGLGNVDNTSDLNKPISTATQTALDGKVDKVPGKALSTNDYTNTDKAIVDGVTSALATKVDKIAGKGLSSNDYTDYEKTKLAYIQNGAEVNVQADWFEANRWSDAFILNKPTKLSDFSNDTGFITSTVDNLTYYYKKSETYTQAEVNALIGSIVTISFLVVQELPTTGETNIIYLVPAEDPNPDNIYEEYIYVNDDWEMIGTTKVDLSNYYTKTETDTLLNGKVNKDGDKVLSDNNYSDTDKSKLDGIEAEANKTVVDNSVTSTSTNPVESKAIYNLLNDLLPEATATGNPIAITNASGLNAKSLKVELEPIQDLHGYDSPWVGGGGKNKYSIAVGNDTFSNNVGGTHSTGQNGELIVNCSSENNFSGVYAFTTGVLRQLLAEMLPCYVSFDVVASMDAEVYLGYQISKNVTTTKQRMSIYYSTDITPSFVVYGKGNAITITISNLMVSKTEEAQYYPYSNICPISGRTQTTVSVNSEDTTIQFGQTVYGGEVDVTSGGTSDKFDNVDLGELNWIYDNTVPRFYTQDLKDVIQKPATTSQIANILVECYKSASLNELYLPNKDSVCAVSTAGAVSVIDRRFTSKDSFVQAISGQMLCYEKATPTTINTPANEISLLKGSNTITGDGDMELIYSKIPQ